MNNLISDNDNIIHSGRQVLSVSELNRKAKQLLEIHLPLMWVEGEISNFSKPSSGHWYLTLKDENAQVRCAMFRNRNNQVRFTPKNGINVQVRARVSLYEGRGDYQLIIEHMEEAGFGILQKRYQELKQKLENEGLFDNDQKKPLPELPRHIAVITSPTGAAVRDVISVLERRFPAIPITVIPAAVQGDGAAQQLIEAIDLAEKQGCFDAILLCRGGGSIEDLWAFNNEQLARRVFAAKTPIISAVGHEIDFTITDFVADLRAPTPSAAAEILSPDAQELEFAFKDFERRMTSRIEHLLNQCQQKLTHARQLMRHPGQKLQIWAQRLDLLDMRLNSAWVKTFQNKRIKQDQIESRLNSQNPANTIRYSRDKIQELCQRLDLAMQHQVKDKQAAFTKAASLLNIVSPLNTLNRGYAIAQNQRGNIIRESAETEKGERLELMLSKGSLEVTVNKTN
ncbi:exodeoxyribonuclease VII large subunit [Teredinibacter haidensis]|uniref:exodeoxyribonuclease VII large subunit n=1 Tax=Teredinibacter haidensis TaxID=2731755 RepID=UPI000948A3D7|nr:exodeoxyribonuclease VII large subunit [Teredinibacter haidensis]